MWENNKELTFVLSGLQKDKREKERNGKEYKEIMTENIPNMVKSTSLRIQESDKIQNGKSKANTRKHSIINFLKTKRKAKILQTSRDKE